MIETIAAWGAAFYLLATAVLVASAAFMTMSRQPARRLSVARGTFAALAASGPIAAAGIYAKGRSPIGPERPATSSAVVETARWPGKCTLERPELPGGEAVSRSPEPICAVQPTAPTESIGDKERPTARGVLVLGFAAGSAGISLWLGVGAIASARLRARSSPASEELRSMLAEVVGRGRVPRLCVCDGIGQPIAMGWIGSTIVLPTRFVAEEPAGRVAAALGHEWGHIRNGDLGMLAISRLFLPILFAHPLYAWLRRRVRADQELLADACAAGERRVEYAEALLEWTKSRAIRCSIGLAPALGLWERKSQLGERIAVLLDRDFRVEPAPPRRWRLGVAGLTAASLICLYAITFRAAAGGVVEPVPHPVDCPCCVPPPPPPMSVMCCPSEPAKAAKTSVLIPSHSIR